MGRTIPIGILSVLFLGLGTEIKSIYFSEKIESIPHFEQVLKEERKTLGIPEYIEIVPEMPKESECSAEARVGHMSGNKYLMQLCSRPTRSSIRHELYHVRHHIQNPDDLSNDPKNLFRYIMENELPAGIYALTGFKIN